MEILKKITALLSSGMTVLLAGMPLISCAGTPAETSKGEDVSIQTVNPSDSSIVTEKKGNYTSGKYYRIDPQGNTLKSRYVCLDNDWERPYTDGYAEWLLSLELHPQGHETRYYNGDVKYNSNRICVGVLKTDLVGNFAKGGKEVPADLQQCADACMRLWAEYLWKNKQYEKIHFKGGNGFVYEYAKWAAGYRVHFDRNWKASWSKDAQPDHSYTTFRKYLSLVFTYCGTLTLSKEMKKVEATDIRPGDILIYGGSPGHAVTVMDVLRNKKTGQLRVMLSQSYMPAQEIEILASPDDDNAPWFDIDIEKRPWVNTPQWYFDFNNRSAFRRWSGR